MRIIAARQISLVSLRPILPTCLSSRVSNTCTAIRLASRRHPNNQELPTGLVIFESEAILDRGSSFTGRACRISDPSEVHKVKN